MSARASSLADADVRLFADFGSRLGLWLHRWLVWRVVAWQCKCLGGSSNSPPRLDPSGAPTPLGPVQYPRRGGPEQGSTVPSAPFRCRRCLLKGCERWYRPTHPQSRYCSDTCRREARRWRRRQASRSWRASAAGKARRREQGRRYRQRLSLPVVPASLPSGAAVPLPSAETDPPVAAATACEGQRPATFSEDFWLRPCQRPGCYTVFAVASAWSPQRFCCACCRRALRTVLDREARYRRRRRAGYRPPRRRARPPPRGPSRCL